MAQSEEHSLGKRKVPGSNPGRSLGHFFRSVISHSSLSFFQNTIFVTLCDFFVSCTHSHTIHAFLNLLSTPPTLFTHLLHLSQLPWHQSHIHSHFNLKTLHLLDCIYKTHTLFLAVFSSWWSSNWAKRRNYLPFLSHQSCHCLINSPPDLLLIPILKKNYWKQIFSKCVMEIHVVSIFFTYFFWQSAANSIIIHWYQKITHFCLFIQESLPSKRTDHNSFSFWFLVFFFADINECIIGDHDCHGNASCTNTLGSFSCQCHITHTGNGSFCEGQFLVAHPYNKEACFVCLKIGKSKNLWWKASNWLSSGCPMNTFSSFQLEDPFLY